MTDPFANTANILSKAAASELSNYFEEAIALIFFPLIASVPFALIILQSIPIESSIYSLALIFALVLLFSFKLRVYGTYYQEFVKSSVLLLSLYRLASDDTFVSQVAAHFEYETSGKLDLKNEKNKIALISVLNNTIKYPQNPFWSAVYMVLNIITYTVLILFGVIFIRTMPMPLIAMGSVSPRVLSYLSISLQVLFVLLLMVISLYQDVLFCRIFSCKRPNIVEVAMEDGKTIVGFIMEPVSKIVNLTTYQLDLSPALPPNIKDHVMVYHIPLSRIKFIRRRFFKQKT